MRGVPWLIIGSLAAACPARAGGAAGDSLDVPVYTLPPVVTTAPRRPPLDPRPGSRTVIDRTWLDRTDPADLSQALLPVAGLRVLASGDGATRTVSIRGLASDRVAVLVDGRALNTAQGGGVDLQPLDLEDVDRIEVTRGALGALYGPDALGGAVNLVRLPLRSPGGSARVTTGTGDRGLVRLRYGGSWDRWSARAVVRAETFSPVLDGRTVHSEGRGGHLRLGLHPSWAAVLEAGVGVREDDRAVPGTRYFPTPDARRRDRYREATLSLTGAAVPGLPGVFDLDAAGSVMDRRYEDPGNPLGALSDRHRNRRARVTAGWILASASGNLEGRVEAVRDRLESTADGDAERDRVAFALQGCGGFGRTSATGAVRLDAVEHFTPEPTLRAAVSHDLIGGPQAGRRVTARVGAGTSFRPPTFDDLFWPARAGAAGNPGLRPERAFDLDAGVEAAGAGFRAQVSVFRSEITDLIQWNPGPDGIWRPHNVSAARVSGIEVEGSTLLPGLPVRLDAALTWMDAVDATGDRVTGGKPLVGRARTKGFGEASLDLGRFTLASGLRSVSRVPLTAAGTKWNEAYVLWHARFRWRVLPSLRLEVEGRNLLDTRYEDIRGYATVGRELLLGFRYTLPTLEPNE